MGLINAVCTFLGYTSIYLSSNALIKNTSIIKTLEVDTDGVHIRGCNTVAKSKDCDHSSFSKCKHKSKVYCICCLLIEVIRYIDIAHPQ